MKRIRIRTGVVLACLLLLVVCGGQLLEAPFGLRFVSPRASAQDPAGAQSSGQRGAPPNSQQGAQPPFAGRVTRAAEQGPPRPVRHDVHQAGQEVVTLRYFKIKKGTFDQFIQASTEGVWPYFAKIGARVIGAWQVITPEGVAVAPAAGADYDEVYMMTRYASLDHWKATRDAAREGGNGPDWIKCREALNLRSSLTLSTKVTFLQGTMATNGPYYMPALGESYEKKGP